MRLAYSLSLTSAEDIAAKFRGLRGLRGRRMWDRVKVSESERQIQSMMGMVKMTMMSDD